MPALPSVTSVSPALNPYARPFRRGPSGSRGRRAPHTRSRAQARRRPTAPGDGTERRRIRWPAQSYPRRPRPNSLRWLPRRISWRISAYPRPRAWPYRMRSDRLPCGTQSARTAGRSGGSSWRPGLLGGDPALDLGVEDRQRHAAVVQNGIVEALDIEAGAQRRLGTLAQIQDLALADLVGESLRRKDDIAVDLFGGFGLGQRAVRDEEIDGLLTCPAA